MRVTHIVTSNGGVYIPLPNPMDIRTFALIRAMCNAHADIVLSHYLD